MIRRVRSHLTYANVVATLCLALVLGGGVAYAANTVFSSDIVNGEVKSVDIADNGVTGADVDESSLLAGRVVLRNRTNVNRATTYPAWRPYPLPNASWTQAADGLDEFAAEYDVTPAPSCTATSAVAVRILVDGQIIGGGEQDQKTLPAGSSRATGHLPMEIPLFEPGVATAHTASAEILGLCTGSGAKPVVNAVRLDVVETR